MSKLTKNQKLVADKVEAGKAYSLKEAAELVKEITTTKFDASLDIDVRLGVDPRKANQMVRGVVSLPNGTGKVTRVLALCTPDQEAAAKEAGADYVGLDEYIDKIKGGWTDVDVIITMPSCMGKLGPLGRVLGPRGLMPNPKSGTVTMDVAKAVKEVKQGKIDFRLTRQVLYMLQSVRYLSVLTKFMRMLRSLFRQSSNSSLLPLRVHTLRVSLSQAQ